MGQTPNLNLPYPELPDSPNVPRDMKALAERLDQALLNTTATIDIEVIDPGPAANQMHIGWNNFPVQSIGRNPYDNGYVGYSNADRSWTDWSGAPVLNPNARWRYTAPADGVLYVDSYFWIGSMSKLDHVAYHVDARMYAGTLSGNVVEVHPNYAHHRHEGKDLNRTGGHLSGQHGHTINLHMNIIMSKGAVVSPYIAWMGKVVDKGDGSRWHPKWSGGRMQGVFIPGNVHRVDPPSNHSTTRDGGPEQHDIGVELAPEEVE